VLNITLTGSGGFVGTLPSDGVGLAAWDGGSVDDVTAGAAALGCRLRSFWISESGQFLGYLQGAPEFVNAAILERCVDSQVPAGTVLLVSCGSRAA